MSAPDAASLFLNVWSAGLYDDERARPGSSEFGPRERAYWARVWLDCSELAHLLSRGEMLRGELEQVAKGQL